MKSDGYATVSNPDLKLAAFSLLLASIPSDTHSDPSQRGHSQNLSVPTVKLTLENL
jgi:hypothetical protein